MTRKRKYTSYIRPKTKLILAQDGDCRAVIAKHRTEARVTPLIALTDSRDQRWLIELSQADAISLCDSLADMLDADDELVARWWAALNRGDNSGADVAALDWLDRRDRAEGVLDS